jgi:hypothetical protein
MPQDHDDVGADLAREASTHAAAHPLHAIVDDWFASHFHNSVVSRDTEIHNHLHAAVQDLKRRLTQES